MTLPPAPVSFPCRTRCWPCPHTCRAPKGFAPLGVLRTQRAGGQNPFPGRDPHSTAPHAWQTCLAPAPALPCLAKLEPFSTGYFLCEGPQTCNQSPLGCIFSKCSRLVASHRPGMAAPHPQMVPGLPPPCGKHRPVPPTAGTPTAHAPARQCCLVGGRGCLARSQQLGWVHQPCCSGDRGGLAPSSLPSSSSPPPQPLRAITATRQPQGCSQRSNIQVRALALAHPCWDTLSWALVSAVHP